MKTLTSAFGKSALTFALMLVTLLFSVFTMPVKAQDNPANATEKVSMIPVSQSQQSAVSPGNENISQPAEIIKIAPHIPQPSDPDYAVKKEQWILNYPEEYNAYIGLNGRQNNFETRQADLENLKKSAPDRYAVQLENYRLTDPMFYQQYMDWMKVNDPDSYNKLINK
jgi:hypothetical protein